MERIATGKQLIEFMKLCYAANRPPLLCGPHGVGKSEGIEQAAREMGIGFVCRDLSLMEPTDLIGLPKLNGKITVYLPPEFLPRGGKGLLVFEELNRCEKYMRAPCLQLLTARVLNDYRLPSGWLPVAAINPSNGEYETSELDPALLSRFVQVEIVPDRLEWLDWARRSGVHAAVVNYVESDDTVFDTAESNPRAWHYVSDCLKAADAEPRPLELLRAAVIGLVGDKRGAAFLRTLKDSVRPLTANAILSSYPSCQALVRGWIKTGRLDLVNTSLRALLTSLQPRADYEMARGSKRKWGNLGLFLADLPGDLKEQAEEFFAGRNYATPAKTTRNRKAS